MSGFRFSSRRRAIRIGVVWWSGRGMSQRRIDIWSLVTASGSGRGCVRSSMISSMTRRSWVQTKENDGP
jgi:hypothetical protein